MLMYGVYHLFCLNYNNRNNSFKKTDSILMNDVTKDLLTLFDYTTDEIVKIVKLAKDLKDRRGKENEPTVFSGKSGVLIFEKPSLRTRITFETAINELGGHSVNLASEMVGMGKRESVEDVARNLDRIVHLIIARTFKHETIEQLAKYSSIPVINALSDLYHPCQALAFALSVYERLSFDEKLNVVFVGDGNNVCNSLMAVSSKLGYNFTIACPRGYEPDNSVQKRAQEVARQTGGSVTITNDLFPAVSRADVIYTDVWTSMGQEAESEKRRSDFKDYQINMDIISKAPGDVLVTHCLPAHRGEEITSEVLDSGHSMAFDEAENRLHAQKAVIVHLFSKENQHE
ncbi:Ornithine carbamoyltransferase [Chitinispirillum alkaliphilum]|nr:Ornithine carbamoyltransferase [Chitinispirillum alkaliphilum]